MSDGQANIMVVDDTPANLNLLQKMLQDKGYRVLAFPDGKMALNAAAKSPPDLILLDINMPDMNGFEVCERLKADTALKDKEMNILVVDDFTNMRKLIRNLLGQGGYPNVVDADDGVSALKTIKSQKIDFIISDWNMPNMTGLELLKAVRADAEIAATPFLMVTAEAIQENVVAAFTAGVSNYIVKPFTAEGFLWAAKKIWGECGEKMAM